jgi:hypothetical protein
VARNNERDEEIHPLIAQIFADEEHGTKSINAEAQGRKDAKDILDFLRRPSLRLRFFATLRFSSSDCGLEESRPQIAQIFADEEYGTKRINAKARRIRQIFKTILGDSATRRLRVSMRGIVACARIWGALGRQGELDLKRNPASSFPSPDHGTT